MSFHQASSVLRQSAVAARLELSGLHKRLGNAGVVDGIDLSVSPGESVVLLGPSGCGKTTTLRLVAGFLEPDAGEIRLDGKLASSPDTFVPPEKRRLGMVFQNFAVWPHKTVYENIAFGLSFTNLGGPAIRSKIQQVLDLVHLSGFAKRYPGDLSGGQQQRVALARAIVKEPSLLLLDEPLSNLDAGLREELRTELKRLHRDTGMTMLYVTHDQEEALVLADRIAVMNLGKVEQFDRPEVIYHQPKSRFVAAFVGVNNLIDVEIVDKDRTADRLLVKSDLGEAFWACADSALVDRIQTGDGATVAVRPEDVVLSTGTGGLPGRVLDASFLGNRYDLTIQMRGSTIRAHSRELSGAIGGDFKVNFDPKRSWVVP